MKATKRILALTLTIALILAAFPSAVFAEGEAPKLVLSNESAEPGESVSVSVNLSDNPGLMVMMFTASYDHGKLALTGISAEGITGWDTNGDNMLWLGNKNNDFNGTILKLNFKVLESAAPEVMPITLICNKGGMANHDEEEFPPEITAGSITITGSPSGSGSSSSGSGTGESGTSGSGSSGSSGSGNSGSGSSGSGSSGSGSSSSGSGSSGSSGSSSSGSSGSGSSGSGSSDTGSTSGTEATVPISQLKIDFEDVPRNEYYYLPVVWAFHHDPQITDGKSKTKFDPMGTCTRGEVVTFLWRAAGCPEPKSLKNQFTDVKETDYFFKPVLWAVEQRITEGTNAEKTHFSPWTTCSTAHIITFLYRSIFTGKDGWYTEAGDWANSFGLLADTGLLTDPYENCPRGAVVTFLYRWSQQQ